VTINHWLLQINRGEEKRMNLFTQKIMKLIEDIEYDNILLLGDKEQLEDEFGNKDEEASRLFHDPLKSL